MPELPETTLIVVLTCKTCLQQVGVAPEGSPEAEGEHYCSVHVPPAAHADEGHRYFGARVEDKPTVRMTVKVDNSGG